MGLIKSHFTGAVARYMQSAADPSSKAPALGVARSAPLGFMPPIASFNSALWMAIHEFPTLSGLAASATGCIVKRVSEYLAV